MKKRQSYLFVAIWTLVFLLTVLAVIVALSAPMFGQQTDPYKMTAAQAPSMADAPLEFEAISVRQMINGAYQYVGWTPKIRGRMLDRTRRGDAVVVELSQDGQDKSKPGFLNLSPGRYFLETYFPNPNAFDLRFNPDAIRNGTLYGRPWISREVMGGMVKLLSPNNPGAMPFPQPTLTGLE